jgi:hypothetical protein
MKFESLINIAEDKPVFETGLLFAGKVTPADVSKLRSRWARAWNLHQLRRGLCDEFDVAALD